jgi:hypothetical protein
MNEELPYCPWQKTCTIPGNALVHQQRADVALGISRAGAFGFAG